MNTIYRIVWNAATGRWMVASELAKGRRKKTATATLSVLALAVAASASALAAQGQVYADGIAVTLPTNTDIDTGTTGGNSGIGIGAINGGTVTAQGPISVRTGGSMAHGIRAGDAGSRIHLNDGGTIAVASGYGLWANGGGEIVATGVTVNAGGTGVVSNNGGHVSLSQSAVNASGFGLHAYNNSTIEATDIVIDTTGGAWGVEANTHSVVTLKTSAGGENKVITDRDDAHGLLAQQAGAVRSSGKLTVTTSGMNATGALAIAGGAIDLNGATISTTGEAAEGVRADASVVTLIDSTVNTSGAFATGLSAINGGSINASNTDVKTSGAYAVGVASDTGSIITVAGGSISTQGHLAHGAVASNGATISLIDSALTTHGDGSQTAWADGAGSRLFTQDVYITNRDPVSGSSRSSAMIASDGGVIEAVNTHIVTERNSNARGATAGSGSHLRYTGGSITTNSALGHAATATGANSSLTLDGVAIETSADNSRGAHANSGAVLSIQGGSINTSGVGSNGLLAQQAGVIRSSGKLTVATSGANTTGALALTGSTMDLNGATITTTGATAEGVRADASVVTLTDTAVNTSGTSATGLYAINAGTINASNTDVKTSGDYAAGILTGTGSNIAAVGGAVDTQGRMAHGAIARSGSSVSLIGTALTSHGNDSYTVWSDGVDSKLFTQDARITNSGSASGASNVGNAAMVASNGGVIEAINTHIVTDGDTNGSGISVEKDSHVRYTGGSITTDSTFGHAATAWGGNSSVTLDGVDIKTQASNSRGARAADDSVLSIRGGSISTSGVGSDGLHALRGGLVSTTNGAIIHTVGDQASAARSTGDTSRIVADSGVLIAEGKQSAGALAEQGGAITLNNVIVQAKGASSTDLFEKSNGIRVNGDGTVNVSGGSVSATGRTILTTGSDTTTTAVVNFDSVSALENDGVLAETTGGTFQLNARASKLSGDLIVDPANAFRTTASASFDNGTQWRGASHGFQSIALAGNSHWAMTADSNVGALNVANAAITFEHDDGTFKTLSVEGDYHGDNALLNMNTVLGSDDAETDRLHVKGSTSGETAVSITNRGGLGEQTDKGILLVQVDNASNGMFLQQGRTVGGLYEYFLHKGHAGDAADGNWYLRSELPLVDPVDPIGPVVPVLRPEPAVYSANQSAAVGMFRHTLHERMGEPKLTSRAANDSNAWVRVTRNQIDQSLVGQFDVDTDMSTLQAGIDLAHWGEQGRGMFGVMFGVGQAKTEALSAVTGYTAAGKVRGSAIGVYGTWYQNADKPEGLYVDTWMQTGRFRNSVQGEGLDLERYDSRASTASVEAGYAFKLADNERRTFYIEPQVQVLASTYKFNGGEHIESNATQVVTNGGAEVTTRLGVRAYGHTTADVNRVQPFVTLNWWHTNGNRHDVAFDGELFGGGAPSDIYEVKVGAQMQLGKRLTGWGELSIQRGPEEYGNIGGLVGLKYSW